MGGRTRDGQWVAAVVDHDGGLALLDKDGCHVTSNAPFKATGVRRRGGPDLFRLPLGCQSPVCAATGRVARPNVMMFMDYGFNEERSNKQCQARDDWLASLPEEARLMILEIGAGTKVTTIREYGVSVARRFRNSTFVRLNMEDAEVPIEEGSGIQTLSIDRLSTLHALSKIDSSL